jgi:hypothetical protein
LRQPDPKCALSNVSRAARPAATLFHPAASTARPASAFAAFIARRAKRASAG